MGTTPVHQALRNISRRLDELGIPYAIVGGMALVAHGYERTTVDVNVLITPDGLEKAKQSLEDRGYLWAFAGNTRSLRDIETGVRIEFLLTGGYPGDGKPKPVAFPEPQHISTQIDGIRYANLPNLIELKLASGMTNPGRLRDLADVQELIRVLSLPSDLAQRLNPYVRQKFIELHTAVGNDPGAD